MDKDMYAGEPIVKVNIPNGKICLIFNSFDDKELIIHGDFLYKILEEHTTNTLNKINADYKKITNIITIKKLCDERLVVNDWLEDGSIIRLYPTSFDKSTINRADLYEYLFKLDNPRLDTRHTYDGGLDCKTLKYLYTDIIIKR